MRKGDGGGSNEDCVCFITLSGAAAFMHDDPPSPPIDIKAPGSLGIGVYVVQLMGYGCTVGVRHRRLQVLGGASGICSADRAHNLAGTQYFRVGYRESPG